MELVFRCKVCGYLEEIDMTEEEDAEEPKKLEDLCVYRHDVLFVAKEAIIVQPDIIYDPTLSRTYDYKCHVCESKEAVFYRLSEAIVSDAMAVIFVCCGCSNWRTEGKEVQYSVPEEDQALAGDEEAPSDS